jgi:K+-transporting ATPase ATPase C chain
MRDLARIVVIVILLALVVGLAYPFFTVLVGRMDGRSADGQIIYRNGMPVGAKNIGQKFDSEGFFHGRPSAAGNGYDAMKSGASNLGPANPQLVKDVKARIAELLKENPGLKAEDIPADLVTGSASGLDPEISVESANLQVKRVSGATGISQGNLRELMRKHTRGRTLGIFGEPGVNVLELNLDVLQLKKEAVR